MTIGITYGEIYWVSFAPSVGHEYQGKRPAVVIQGDKSLKKTNLVTVMPLTSQITKPHSDDILVSTNNKNNLYADSLIKVHHIESFDQSRLIKRIGSASDEDMLKIKKYLKSHFNI